MAENKFYNVVGIPGEDPFIDLTKDTVRPEYVTKGKTFHLYTGEIVEGTNDFTVNASEANASEDEVLVGVKFANASGVHEGKMPNNQDTEVIITNTTGTTIPKGYFTGLTKATLSQTDIDLLRPEYIKEGVTILGVKGEYGADDISSQSKEVTPTFEDQTITPDPDYTFLSSVKVNAIKVTETPNNFGGITVTIGG